MTPLLRLDGVRYRYPGATSDALHGVSLAIAPKQFHAVLGPNGSGKTTLVRVALGALLPLVGRADIDGRSASSWPRQDLARLVGVVPQREDNLFPQRARGLRRAASRQPLALDAFRWRVPARPSGTGTGPGAEAPRARRARNVARPET